MKLERPALLDPKRVLHHLHSGSVVMLGGLMLGNAVAYVYHMLMARLMSPAEYGTLVTLTAMSYVLAVLMRTFQAWVIRAVAAARGQGTLYVRAVFIIALRVLLPFGVIVICLHWLASDIGAHFLHLESGVPIVLLGLITVSNFLVPIPRGVLLGLKRLHFPGIVYVLEPIVRVVAGVGLVAWGLGVNGALLGFVLGNAIAFIALTIPLWSLLTATPTPASVKNEVHTFDRYALVVLIVNACLMLMTSLDQIAVKHFFSADVAGNYAVAFLLGQVIAMSTISLGWVLFTRAATMAPSDPGHGWLLLKGLLVIGALALGLTASYLIMPALATRMMGGAQYPSARAYVGLVGVEMSLFALVYIQAYYHMARQQMHILWPLCIATLLEIALLARFHGTVQQILFSIIVVLVGVLIWMSLLSWKLLVLNARPGMPVLRGLTEAAADLN